MIRILVLVLLSINLLYLGWSRWIARDAAQLTAVTTTPAPAGQTPPPAAPAVPPPPPPCASLGPFSDDALAMTARDQLVAAGWGVLQRSGIETSREGWWVHVDNADSNQQARTLATIRRAGIADAFAMPDDAAFRVSVGIFSIEDRAEDRAAEVQRLQLDALVSQRVLEQPVIWLDVPGVARETLSDGRLATAGIALDRLRIESCPTDSAPAAAPPEEPAAAIIPAP